MHHSLFLVVENILFVIIKNASDATPCVMHSNVAILRCILVQHNLILHNAAQRDRKQVDVMSLNIVQIILFHFFGS